MSALSIRYGSPATLPVDVLLGMIPSLPRAALDRLTQRMIDRLDEIDGDPELEDGDDDECPARDDGCGPIIDWNGNVVWGFESDIAG